MSAYYSIATRLLDAGQRVLVTPELGRHRKPGLDSPVTLLVKQVTVTVEHNVMVWFTNGDKMIVPPDMIVKVLA